MKTFNLPSPGGAGGLAGALMFLVLGSPALFAQFPGGFPGGGGGNGRNNNNNSGGLQAATQVTAVADEYSNSLIILAPENYQQAISNLVSQLDVAVQDLTELRVFPLQNADPTEMAQVLTSLFPDESASNANTGNRGAGFLFRGGGRGNNNNGNESERAKKQSKVLAVADPRTSSVIVSASQNLMEQIGPMIQQLDASTAKKQHAYVYQLKNADTSDVQTVLQDLFETTNTRNSRSSQNSQQNNALQQRQTNAARNQGTTTSSSFGSSSGLGGSGLGGNGR
jgi:general secretion pathway protein D